MTMPVTPGNIPCKPFLRWAGSKRQLIAELSRYWPSGNTRYIEPFAGSACLFFHLAPEQAVLGDLNADLMNTYRNIRCDVERVIECLRRLPIGKDAYYLIRAITPQSLTGPEQAARFIYLNRYCFNGLYRTNRSGGFNVPYGDPKGSHHIDEDRLRVASRLFRDTQFVCGDFEETLQYALPGDFVYLDPPYTVSHRRGFTEYQATGFTTHDLGRLRRALTSLDGRGIAFLVSYAESPEAELLKQGWHWTHVQTRRNIAGFSGSRGTASEVLVSNVERKEDHGQT